MNTFVNKSLIPIDWQSFISLCKDCGLKIEPLSDKNKFSFSLNGKKVMHQVRHSATKDVLSRSGWFNKKFNVAPSGHDLSKNGHVRVLDTIDPQKPLSASNQKAFVYFIELVYSSK